MKKNLEFKLIELNKNKRGEYIAHYNHHTGRTSKLFPGMSKTQIIYLLRHKYGIICPHSAYQGVSEK